MLKGKTWKFLENVDTDQIIPARYLNSHDPKELASHVMEDAIRPNGKTDPELPKRIKAGDIFVGGENFGCGSSREHAPIAIKAAGVQAVIAKSYARIFYRNAINIGLPIFESADAVDNINEGDEIEIDAENGLIKNLASGKTFKAPAHPDFMQQLVKAGGLMNYIKTKLGR
jgi:3-isopropylmalate dehydratase small subunit